jgi:hypothetical protein
LSAEPEKQPRKRKVPAKYEAFVLPFVQTRARKARVSFENTLLEKSTHVQSRPSGKRKSAFRTVEKCKRAQSTEHDPSVDKTASRPTRVSFENKVTESSGIFMQQAEASNSLSSSDTRFFELQDVVATILEQPCMTQDTSEVCLKEQKRPCPISSAECLAHMKSLIHEPYEKQLEKCEEIEQQFNPIQVRDDLSVLSIGADIDVQSASLVPFDVHVHDQNFQGMLPVKIFGDGNCLARCASVLAYGSEEFHLELRLRIAMEMIQHKHLYLDGRYLARGAKVVGKFNLPQRYAQFSEIYTHQVLTHHVVSYIFDKEIHSILKAGNFMGVWQLFAMSSVLKIPLFAVYPKMGNPAVRADMHRLILPREESSTHSGPKYIMWTTNREDMPAEHWQPNHFVVLLPVWLQTDGINKGDNMYVNIDNADYYFSGHYFTHTVLITSRLYATANRAVTFKTSS